MKKNLVYQRPSLYNLNNDNALGLCNSGSAASGSVFPNYTNCLTGNVADGSVSIDSCSNGNSDSNSGSDGCANGPSVSSNGTACDTGSGV